LLHYYPSLRPVGDFQVTLNNHLPLADN